MGDAASPKELGVNAYPSVGGATRKRTGRDAACARYRTPISRPCSSPPLGSSAL